MLRERLVENVAQLESQMLAAPAVFAISAEADRLALNPPTVTGTALATLR